VFWYGWLNIIFIDFFLHIFRFDAILSGEVYGRHPPMAEIHPRLKISADQPDQHSLRRPTEDALEPLMGVEENVEDIPIFCAGGCGEVMGYVRTGDSIPTRWCPVCESEKASESEVIEAIASDTDELAELRSAPRDLRKAHFIQVLAVGLIFAGSIYIALGRPIGIYLAALGTLIWIAVGLVLWRLRS
jgi:hypothetical protein